MEWYKKGVLFLLPILVSFFLHYRVFCLDVMGIHVWRQAQTQTVIYNFQFSDNNILHPQRFDLTKGTTSLLYEFPLYQWLIAQINIAIGYSVLHTRLITFLVFSLFLLAYYRLLRLFVSIKTALVTNWLLCFSPLLYYYCVNPLPDLLALCFSIWALLFFFAYRKDNRILSFALFAVFLSLAALVKLPYILFAGVLIPEIYSPRGEISKRTIMLAVIFLTALLPVYVWYESAMPTWTGNPIVKGMSENDKSIGELVDILWFNIVSSVPELLTNYASCLFLILGIYLYVKDPKPRFPRDYFLILLILFSVYFLYEINLISKTHEYYLLPFVPLIFLVVAFAVSQIVKTKLKWLVFLVICLVPLTAWLRIDHRWDPEHPGFEKDYLVYQDKLQSVIPSNGICIIDRDPSSFIALYYLKRRGYSLKENEMSREKLVELYAKGARYLISDDTLLNPSRFKNYGLALLFQNHIRVWKLSSETQ